MRFGVDTSGMVDTFAAQFESDGKGSYLYRRYGRGAAILVSAAERDDFVATFTRQSRWWLTALAIATVAILVSFAFVGVALHLGDVAQYVGVATMLAACLATMAVLVSRAYDAPRRALTGRQATGVVRRREEAQRIARARQSWADILVVFVVFIAVLVVSALRYDLWHGWGRLWWFYFAFGMGACGFGAIRKWRAGTG